MKKYYLSEVIGTGDFEANDSFRPAVADLAGIDWIACIPSDENGLPRFNYALAHCGDDHSAITADARNVPFTNRSAVTAILSAEGMPALIESEDDGACGEALWAALTGL